MAYLATIVPFGFEDFFLPTWLPVLRQLGCVSCQFARNEENPPKPAEAVKIANDAGLPFDSIHGVFGQEYDPSNPDQTIRRKAVKAYQAEAELALKLGCAKVVVHPSPSSQATLFPTPEPDRLDAMRQTFEELAATGEKLGVTFLFENLPRVFMLGHDPVALADLLREANHPNLKMCFDTGHAHMTSDVVEVMNACADVIDYLHVHDNNSRHDSHLIPDHGTIPWDKLGPAIAALPSGTAAMLELFSSRGALEREYNSGLAQKLRPMLGLD